VGQRGAGVRLALEVAVQPGDPALVVARGADELVHPDRQKPERRQRRIERLGQLGRGVTDPDQEVDLSRGRFADLRDRAGARERGPGLG
jgi:hypothetical protein